jgi:hypothetical protein
LRASVPSLAQQMQTPANHYSMMSLVAPKIESIESN